MQSVHNKAPARPPATPARQPQLAAPDAPAGGMLPRSLSQYVAERMSSVTTMHKSKKTRPMMTRWVVRDCSNARRRACAAAKRSPRGHHAGGGGGAAGFLRLRSSGASGALAPRRANTSARCCALAARVLQATHGALSVLQNCRAGALAGAASTSSSSWSLPE